MVQICNAKPVIVPTAAANDYILSPETLRKALEENPKVSCIILCNPSNPSGCVADKGRIRNSVSIPLHRLFIAYYRILSHIIIIASASFLRKAMMEKLAAVLLDFPKVAVLSDEIYEQVGYRHHHLVIVISSTTTFYFSSSP
jgi:aspartate/methionine/tyrosine aminotransferase